MATLAFYYWAVLILAQHDTGVQRFERAADATRDCWIFDHFVFREMRAQQRNRHWTMMLEIRVKER